VTCLLVGLFAAPVCAQQTATNAPAMSTTPQELAKSVHNPFDFIKIAFQSATGFSIGRHHNADDSFNLQPFFPFSLNGKWDLLLAQVCP
jgi:hypothetical protein